MIQEASTEVQSGKIIQALDHLRARDTLEVEANLQRLSLRLSMLADICLKTVDSLQEALLLLESEQ